MTLTGFVTGAVFFVLKICVLEINGLGAVGGIGVLETGSGRGTLGGAGWY